MRVDKDDRYVSEQPKKDATPSLKIPSFLQEYSKTKIIIVSLAIMIVLLLLSLIIFRSNPNKGPTPLTPTVVNGEPSTTNTNSNGTNTNEQNVANNNTEIASSNSNENSQNEFTPNLTSDDSPDKVEVSNGSINEQNSNNIHSEASITPNDVNSTNNSTNTQNLETNQTQINTIHPGKNVVNHNRHNSSLTDDVNIENDHYSIQLSASSSMENLKKFAKLHKITNYQIYETKRNNSPWFILIHGNYSSANEAKRAIKSLPSALQKDKPWVKPGTTINKEKAVK